MSEIFSHPISAILIMLGVLVFFHELGHFLAAKFFNIGVEAFSIGFGPKILGFTHKNTVYQIGALPLGGYVKLCGAIESEEVPEVFKGQEMHKASNFAKACVLFAGPLANFLLAFFIFTFLGMVGLPQRASIIGTLQKDGVAEKSGLRPMDQIVRIGNESIKNWDDMQKIITESPEKPLDVFILRNEKEILLHLVPKKTIAEDRMGIEKAIGRIGITDGIIPAIVTIVDQNSEAYKLGFRTGDKIESIKVLDKDEVIQYWFQFEEALKNNLASNARMDFKIKRDDKILSIQIEGYQGKTLQDLGFLDSTLTILKAEDPSVELLPKDYILAVEGQGFKDIFDLSEILQKNKKSSVKILVNRSGEQKEVSVTLKEIEIQKAKGKETIFFLNAGFLGSTIQQKPIMEKYDNIFEAFSFGFFFTVKQTKMIAGELFGLLTGRVPLQALGGPIMIAQVAGESMKAGYQAFLMAISLISINLGIVNLFPIPILDGGQLVMVAIESIRRKKLSQLAYENFQKIGFIFVMALFVLSTYNDFSRFWSSMVKDLLNFLK